MRVGFVSRSWIERDLYLHTLTTVQTANGMIVIGISQRTTVDQLFYLPHAFRSAALPTQTPLHWFLMR